MTPKGKEFPYMLELWGDNFVMLLDDVVEAKLEPRMLAKRTKCLWYRPLRIKNAKNVAGADLTKSR